MLLLEPLCMVGVVTYLKLIPLFEFLTFCLSFLLETSTGFSCFRFCSYICVTIYDRNTERNKNIPPEDVQVVSAQSPPSPWGSQYGPFQWWPLPRTQNNKQKTLVFHLLLANFSRIPIMSINLGPSLSCSPYICKVSNILN